MPKTAVWWPGHRLRRTGRLFPPGAELVDQWDPADQELRDLWTELEPELQRVQDHFGLADYPVPPGMQ